MKIRGYYINLDNSLSRREKMEAHLKELSWGNSYKRFSAQESEKNEAEERGLTKGEYGLWKSWIKLLGQIVSKSDFNSYDYLHILEDDAVIYEKMFSVLNQLNIAKQGIEILVTEMYANEEIWRHLSKIISRSKGKKSIGIFMHYTGCTSSVLIPTKSIGKVYAELNDIFKHDNKLQPIDNTIVKLQHQGRLKIGCTVPFLSRIDQDSIQTSNIQSVEERSSSIMRTQQINSLLRQQLSISKDEQIYNKILTLLIDLAKQQNKSEYKISLLTAALNLAKKEEIFRYRLDPRLKDTPNNPQNDDKYWEQTA